MLRPWMEYVGVLLIGFFCGGILFSYHLPKWIKRVDIVALSEDHNPGAANAFQYGGVPVGLLCVFLDLLKGYFPVQLAMSLYDPACALFAFFMLAPVLGHAMAPCYPFAGGKAIAVSFGALLGLMPFSYAVFALAALYLFFSLIKVIEPHERRTVVVFFLFIIVSGAGALFTRHFAVALGCCMISCVVISKNGKLPVRKRRGDVQNSGAAT